MTPRAMITLPYFPTPSRMTTTAGQTKILRNPARKKQKTDDAVVLSKDNSDILNKLEKEFNVSEQDGAEIHGNLATIVQKLLKDKYVYSCILPVFLAINKRDAYS